MTLRFLTLALLGLGACGAPAPDKPRAIEVAVIGAGPAGLAAAWELEHAGRSTELFEGRDAVGGRARWGEGLMVLAGTSSQRAQGIEDSPLALEEDWAKVTGAEPDPWTRAFIRAAPAEVHDWMLGMGLRIRRIEPEQGTGKLRVHHPESGSPGVVRVLASSLKSPVHTSTWVTSVTPLPEGGFEIGFEAPTGADRVQASRLVLATGSHLSLLDRARELASRSPCPMDALVDGKEGPTPARADLLNLLQPLRPALENESVIGTYPHVLPTDGFPFVDVARTVWVDGSGQRFFDERSWISVAGGAAVQKLEGCKAWAVFDAREAEAVLKSVEPSLRHRLLKEDKILLERETLQELALAMGVDPNALGLSLDARPADANIPGKPMMPGPRKPVEAPFYAARLGLVAGKSFGGLSSDDQARVLDLDGRPIPGLFAAGELTGMGSGGVGVPYGFDGSLSAVIWSGRVAGRHAAKR